MTTKPEMENKKLALFVGTEYVGVVIVNALVPRLLAAGIAPVLLDAGTHQNRKIKKAAPQDVSFYNIRAMADAVIPYMESAVAQAPADAPKCRVYKQLAQHYGLEYHEITDVNDAATAAIVDSIEGHVVGALNIRQQQIYSDPTIMHLNTKGFFWNMHSGLLPDYRGLLVPYRAIVNGERDYGWTLHEINAGIDTGSILATCKKPLDPEKPVLETYLGMVDTSVDMIMRVLDTYLSGRIDAIRTPNEGGHYYSYPTEEELSVYQRMGIRYVQSPKAYVDTVVAQFSAVGTAHGNGLRDSIVQAMASHLRAQTQNAGGTLPAAAAAMPKR